MRAALAAITIALAVPAFAADEAACFAYAKATAPQMANTLYEYVDQIERNYSQCLNMDEVASVLSSPPAIAASGSRCKRYRSYDSKTRTYRGYDHRRHACR